MRLKVKLLIFLILIIVVFISYFPTFFNGFIYDDQDLILENQVVTQHQWSKIFTSDHWESTRGASPYFRPLVITSFTLEYFLWRQNPRGYHLDNVLLHLLTALFIWAVAEKISKNKLKSTLSPHLPWLAAMTFALHPANSQTVYWISARGDLLATLGIVAGIYFCLINSWRKYPGVIVATALAIFSKETGILSLALIPLSYLFFSSPKKKKIPLIVFTALIVMVFAIYMLLRVRAVQISPFVGSDESFWYPQDGHLTRILTLPAIWGYYLLRGIFPYYLNFETGIHLFYAWNDWQFILGLFSIALTILLSVIMWKNKIYRWFILFWTISLLPVLNIIPAFESGMEHYLYLPLTAGSIFAASLVIKKKLIIKIFPLILLTFAVTVFIRGKIWNNPEIFWKDAVAKTGIHCRQGWIRSRYNLAGVYLDRYREETTNAEYLDKAEQLYREIFKSYPHYGGLYISFGDIAVVRGNNSQAIEFYQQAIQRYPQNHIIYNKLAICFAVQNNYPEAERNLRRSLELKPDYQDGILNLTHILLVQGDIAQASQLLYTMENPTQPEFKVLSYVLETLQDNSAQLEDSLKYKAVQIFQEAGKYRHQINLMAELYQNHPEDSNLLFDICLVYYSDLNEPVKWLEHIRQGYQKFPGDWRFARELGVYYIINQDSANAVKMFKKVLELNPDNPEAPQMRELITSFQSSY
ncbi:MAG: tetratricopeptide repeat protein [bacterium]